MSITFPCWPKADPTGYVPPPGQPARATPCQCAPGPATLNHGDTCHRCGRYPAPTINRTWADRAVEIARNRHVH